MDCEGCDATPPRQAKRGGLCWACLKSLKRNGSTARKRPERGVRHPTPRAMVVEAALDLADPEKDEDRAWARLRMAWRRYLLKRRAANTVHKPPNTP